MQAAHFLYLRKIKSINEKNTKAGMCLRKAAFQPA